MKKRLISFLTIISVFLFIGNVQAIEIDKDDIAKGSYVIGTHLFEREQTGTLTVQHIMLAAQTIGSDKLEDMKIYFKTSRGAWVNGLTNESVIMPENIKIDYQNTVDITVPSPTLILSKGYGPDEYIGFEDGSYVYANSHNSEMIITGSNYNDYYEAFKENNTQITDNGGNDTLEINNSYASTRIIFNVDSDYSIEKDGVNFGDVTFTYKDDVDNWLNGVTNKHLTVKDNAIENIIIGDEESDTWGTRGRMTTNVQIAELAETVAGWLATNDYTDVNAVISGKNADDIAALTAIFTEGNYWNAIT